MISAGFRVLRLGALPIVFFGALIFQANAQTAPGPGHAPASTSEGRSVGGVAPPAGAGPDGSSAVKSVTRSAESAISICPDDTNSQRCIADALDAYADALRNLSPSLPPDLQELPDIVSRAARQVRQAKTKAQAIKAVQIAIAEVHKTISLLKADDPVVLKVETREGAFVAETLEVADNKLEKAVGL